MVSPSITTPLGIIKSTKTYLSVDAAWSLISNAYVGAIIDCHIVRYGGSSSVADKDETVF